MPEGPEVKRTVDNLQKYKNKMLNKITINAGRYSKKPFKNQSLLLKDLPLKIIEINCKGKFIYWKFSNNKYLFNTLGMSGEWTTEDNKHNNVTFEINDKKLHFNDYRNFGTLMYQTETDLEKKLKELGVDIIEDFKNITEFKKRLEKKRDDALIGTTLLDQKVVSGCGNYLRAEVLYQCKISPHRILKNLSEKDKENLWEKLTKLAWIFYDLDLAIKKGILKKNEDLVKQYFTPDYEEYGYYTNFIIYFQEKDPKGNKIITEKMGPRTIHWVPEVQK
jgi:DNA-formamidopyrimidine glycosylase